MALTRTGVVTLVCALSVAALACLWPTSTKDLSPLVRGLLAKAGCPLGYDENSGVPLPDDHPAVSGDAVVPGVRVLTLHIYHNGTIWTADPELRLAACLVVEDEGGSIVHVGSSVAGCREAAVAAGEEAEARRMVRHVDRDLHGAFLMPGMVDARMHVMWGGAILPTDASAGGRTDDSAVLARAAAAALAAGLTTVGDFGRPLCGVGDASWGDLEGVYARAADAGSLPLRVSVYTPLASWSRLSSHIAGNGYAHSGSGRLFWGGAAAWGDGRPGYVCDVEGGAVSDDIADVDLLPGLVETAEQAGLQVSVHASTSQATTNAAGALRLAADARTARPPSPQRHATGGAADIDAEAAPHPTPLRMDLPLSLEGVTAAAASGEWLSHPGIMAVLSPQPESASTPAADPLSTWRSLAHHGVSVAYASGWPLSGIEISPQWALTALAQDAVQHSSIGAPWAENELAEVEAILAGVTRGAARALGLADYVGMLRQGMRADFVMLDRSPLAGPWPLDAPPAVLSTFVDASCAYGFGASPWVATAAAAQLRGDGRGA
ncbi:hypothetical protein FOA52_011626 [Chlamydomonas sp. UWO 241]|nr:hypothetical protein FOA52_011626 [Chlamydomonas sp. UWO 241]